MNVAGSSEPTLAPKMYPFYVRRFPPGPTVRHAVQTAPSGAVSPVQGWAAACWGMPATPARVSSSTAAVRRASSAAKRATPDEEPDAVRVSDDVAAADAANRESGGDGQRARPAAWRLALGAWRLALGACDFVHRFPFPLSNH